jgi:hypothetical protein
MAHGGQTWQVDVRVKTFIREAASRLDFLRAAPWTGRRLPCGKYSTSRCPLAAAKHDLRHEGTAAGPQR